MENQTKRDRLMPKTPVGFDRLTEGQWESVAAYNKGYMAFLDSGKTERECVAEAIFQAEELGFKEYVPGMELKAGDKIYTTRMNKTMALAVIGKKPLSEGFRMLAAHVDVPRLDLKPNPLYEDAGFGLLKTHYYGGVKKYQWLTMPLELRGIVFKSDGTAVNVCIGADESEPVLVISDLLPHFAADQMKKTVSEAFTAELLNAIVGTIPDAEQGENRVKLAVLELLEQKYGIMEADFATAELSLVPAGCARDVGLDRSLIGGYGHDDRCCSYAGMRAIFDIENPEYTAIAYLADKEEIGSEGITGMQSGFFDMFMEELCNTQGVSLRRCYSKSFCLSGDVTAAFDPSFPEVADAQNHARLNYGVGICKYTGRGGKSGASDASAETMSHLRRLFESGKVFWQAVELGKADKGGGGTVAAYLARRNIEVVDAGVPVLAMHAPFEIISKLDNYMTYKACLAVFGDK